MRSLFVGLTSIIVASTVSAAPKTGDVESASPIVSSLSQLAPDRYWLAAVVDDGARIDVWNLQKRVVAFKLAAPKGDRFTALAFSADGNTLAAGLKSGSVVGWDRAAAREIWTLKSPIEAPMTAIVWSPDRKRLISVQKAKVGVLNWDLASKSSIAMGSGEHSLMSSFSADGKLALSVHRNEAWLLNHDGAKRATKVWANDDQTLARAIATPDGKSVAVLHAKGLELWSLSPFVRHEPLDYPESAEPFFTGNGKFLAVVRMTNKDKGVIDLWDIADGLANATFRRSIDGLVGPGVTTDRDRSVAAFLGDRGDLVRLAGLDQKSISDVGKDYRFSSSSPDALAMAELSPDGRYLATSHKNGLIRLWDLAAKQTVIERKQGHMGVRFDPVEVPTPVVLGVIRGPLGLKRLQFVADNSTLLVQTNSDRHDLLDLSVYLKAGTPRVLTFKFSIGGAQPRSLDYSPDAKTLAVVPNFFGHVFLIDLKSNKGPQKIAGSPFLIRFNAAGTRLMMLSEHEIAQYDFELGLKTVAKKYNQKPPEDSWKERLTDGLVFDNKIRIVDPDRLALVSTVVPESVDRFGQHALSRDGLRYAFLGRKKTGAGYGLDIVDTQKSEMLASMPLSIDSFYGVRFLSDPRRVVVATADTLVGVNYARRQSAVIWPKPTEKQPVKNPARPTSDGGSVAGAAADDLGVGPERRMPFVGIRALDVSPHDVAAVATVGGNVLLIDLMTGQTLHQLSVPDQGIVMVKFSDDGNHLTVAQETGRLTLANCAPWNPRRPRLPAK